VAVKQASRSPENRGECRHVTISPSRRPATELAIEVVAVCALAAAIVTVVAGDIQFGVAGLVFRARSPWRALVVGVVALGSRLVLASAPTREAEDRHRGVAAVLCRVTCLTVLAADLGLVLGRLVTACGGLDSAGYLGAARFLLAGRLTEFQPIARLLPFAGATAAAAPLGFVAAAQPFYIAPEFPLGLPLVMAAFRILFGPSGPFYVAPVLGAATVALASATVRRSAGSTVALLAAVLVATNPIFLDMALQPMSDVPAAFWLVLAAFALWRPAPSGVAAGLAAGMAVLTRPPLLLACVALAATTRWRTRGQPILFAAITLGFVAGLLLLQWHLYGSPLASGHGSAGQLFTLAALRENVVHHAKWLVVVHTPLILVAFASAFFGDRRLAVGAGAVFLATAAPYLVYATRFDDWEILRFLLPGLVFVFMACACGVAVLVRGGAERVRTQLAVACVALVVAAASLGFLARHHVFDLWRQESKYPLVGDWFAKNTPANAVAIAALHSGSLRYYSGRATLRMEGVPEGKLLETVDALQKAGYEPYLVLEQPDEIEAYQRRFHPDAIGSLKLYPRAEIRSVYIIRLAIDPKGGVTPGWTGAYRLPGVVPGASLR